MAKLTEMKIRKVKPADKDLWLNDGNGLYLRVRKSGSKKWIIRQKRHGKTRITSLGGYPGLGLKEARAKTANHHLSDTPSSVTVDTLVEKYMSKVIEPTHRRPELARGYMERAILPAIGKRKVREVTRAELVEMIEDYSTRGARTADQLRSNLKHLFAYGVELGYRDSNPMLEVTRRVAGYIPVARDRVLTDDEIKRLWQEEKHNANMLRFLLLTGLRISEAQKGYQDGDRWIVPTESSKNKKAHWVYLTKTAKAQLPLPSSTPTNIQAWLRRWCEKHKVDPRYTPHDLRRTAATRMNDNGIEPFIVERVLNHTLEGVMAVYNRAEYEKERIAAAKTLEKCVLKVVST